MEWVFNYRFPDGEPTPDDASSVEAPSIASRGEATGLDGGPLYYVDVDAIEVRSRLRELDEEELSRLQESLSQRGLLHPLLVRFAEGSGGPTPVLVAGNYRLEAARRLGWRQILCRVVEASDIEFELMAIDENVARVDLSPAAKAVYMGRRYELYELLYGPAKARGAHAANAAMGNANAADTMSAAFTTATASLTGEGERTIQRGVARAKALGPDLLKRVSGTSLDRGTELDALSALPPEARDELVERAVAGKQVSAAAALKKVARQKPAQADQEDQPAKAVRQASAVEHQEPVWDLQPLFQTPDDDRVNATCDALWKLQQDWLGAPIHARVLFLSWLAAGWTSPEDRH